jgi:hypothetical protein
MDKNAALKRSAQNHGGDRNRAFSKINTRA